jgi:nucleoside-diphosphate-sugar epimerase
VPHSEVFGTAFEDLAIRVPDVSAIRAAIGFEPAIPLDTTIADVAASRAGIAGGRP